MLKNQKGITLIALVITIIVLLILVGVTLSFVAGENGILKRATNAVDVNERAGAEEQANLLLADLAVQYYEEKYVNHKEGLTTLDDYLEEQVGSGREADTGEYAVKIEDGQVIVSKGEKEISKGTLSNGKVLGWTESASEGSTPTPPKPDNSTAGKTDTSKNRTLAGTTEGYTYKNPVIPQGFCAVNDGAEWMYTDSSKTEVTGWNDGLVIQDEIGNQFVWVPVDGTNVKYEKWCTVGIAYSRCANDTSVYPLDEEIAQISTYGGFYVARYEAGNENALANDATTNNTGTVKPVSIAGTKVWNWIDYRHAVAASKLMINDESIYGNNKSGLITGTQWDTIMKWYENAGIKIDETQDWGTVYDLGYSGNGKYFTSSNYEWTEGTFTHTASTEPRVFHAAGLNSNGIKKNIADLGGNLDEVTCELYGGYGSIRGGDGMYPRSVHCAASRSNGGWNTYVECGFRTALKLQ